MNDLIEWKWDRLVYFKTILNDIFLYFGWAILMFWDYLYDMANSFEVEMEVFCVSKLIQAPKWTFAPRHQITLKRKKCSYRFSHSYKLQFKNIHRYILQVTMNVFYCSKQPYTFCVSEVLSFYCLGHLNK